MAKPRTCQHCAAEIEWYPGTGWVDTISGDDRGTYDNCPRGIDAPHVPAKEA